MEGGGGQAASPRDRQLGPQAPFSAFFLSGPWFVPFTGLKAICNYFVQLLTCVSLPSENKLFKGMDRLSGLPPQPHAEH